MFHIPKKKKQLYLWSIGGQSLWWCYHWQNFAFFHTKQVDSSMIYHWTDVQQHGIYFFKLINPPFPWPHYMEEMFVCISLYKRFTWTWWLQCWEKNRLILKGINHIWFFSQRQKFISLCYAAVITCFIFFSSQEYVSDLFHYLHNSSESPQLIALLESFLFSVVRDVKHYSSENQRLEEALKRYSRL